jgi:hypothetical protein
MANVARVCNILNSNITLTYFDGEGRAEISRLILSAGNIKFNDVRHSFESFGKLKADKNSKVWKRFGQLPLLEHTYEGGSILLS